MINFIAVVRCHCMKQLFLIPLIFLASACGDSADTAQQQASVPAVADEYEKPAPSTSYEEAHAAAVASIGLSNSVGHAWSTADALLAEGAEAAAAGDEELAILLTDKARMQADLSIRQAEHEDGAWTERVLSD